LEEYSKKLDKFTSFSYHPKKIGEIGHILKTFYELYDNETYNKTFLFTFGFHGYLENMVGCQKNIREKKMNHAQFIKTSRKKKNVFKKSYYASLSHDLVPVKNDIVLKKNLIITGPNAAGKTTILKSTLLNIILTQQIGCGFYDSAKFHPYHHIHCYLNIPDTSGRDSLFQAEARRCKEIIDTIDSHKGELHFCIFDELFSGTNPEEAVISGTAFMTYLVKNKNLNCMLTTHFIDVCHHLEKNANIVNYKMDTRQQDDKIQYTYLLKKGISSVKGGFQVLRDMNYPREIIKNTHLLSTAK
jgi:DNA mismatch repair ATPase MutS